MMIARVIYVKEGKRIKIEKTKFDNKSVGQYADVKLRIKWVCQQGNG